MNFIDVKNVEPENEVLVRFQAPRAGQTSNDARVTQLDWHTTKDQVKATFKDFYNSSGANIQLWLVFNLTALSYAGINCSDYVKSVSPQTGLDADNVAVSFILPSGLQRIKQLQCDPSPSWHDNDKEAAGLVVGIDGNLHEDDLVYTTMKHVKERTKESRRKGTNRIVIDAEGAGGNSIQIRLERV